MIKEHYRDYATEAFRLYARMGKPTYKELKQIYFDEALKNAEREIGFIKGTNIAKPTEYALINAERAVDEKMGELLDILAVEKVINILDASRDGHPIKRAVEIVYFEFVRGELRRGEIVERVTKAQLEIPASERQVYYWLKQARKMFALERGLRV